MASEEPVGKVTHYYSNIGVAIIAVSAVIRNGDHIRIKGSSTDITQVVRSMQIQHINVEEANEGDEIGLKVDGKVRKGDIVYKILQ
ncbi:MAG: translation elongation factor-like protein [Candidatus Micrarchaeia archaeon]